MVVGYRLPGWTGGADFYLSDGQTFVLVRGGEALKSPPVWLVVALRGCWLADNFGTA